MHPTLAETLWGFCEKSQVCLSDVIELLIRQVEDWPEWVQTVSCLSHLLTTFNSSVNFFIYFIKYKQRKHNNQSLTSVDLEILTTTLVWAGPSGQISSGRTSLCVQTGVTSVIITWHFVCVPCWCSIGGLDGQTSPSKDFKSNFLSDKNGGDKNGSKQVHDNDDKVQASKFKVDKKNLKDLNLFTPNELRVQSTECSGMYLKYQSKVLPSSRGPSLSVWAFSGWSEYVVFCYKLFAFGDKNSGPWKLDQCKM